MTYQIPEEMPPDVARILEKFRRDDIDIEDREGHSRFSMLQLEQLELVQPYCPPENWVIENIIQSSPEDAYGHSIIIASLSLLVLHEDEDYPIPDSLFHIKQRAIKEEWFLQHDIGITCHLLDLIIIIDNVFREILRIAPRYCDIRIIAQMACRGLFDKSEIGDHMLYGHGTDSGGELTKLYDWMTDLIVCPMTLYQEIVNYIEEHLMGKHMPDAVKDQINQQVCKYLSFEEDVEIDEDIISELRWDDNWGFQGQSSHHSSPQSGFLGFGSLNLSS